MLNVIIYTTIVGVIGTGLGGLVGSLFKKDSSKLTSILLSLAGGIMLSVVCFDLIPSSIDHSNIYIAATGILLSVVFIYFLNNLIDKFTEKRSTKLDENHPKTHDELDELIHSDTLSDYRKNNESTRKLFQAGIIMVLAIALHNFPEGLSIGASYYHSQDTGLILAILIALHNIPEGMAIVVPLIVGGMKKSTAVLLTALSGLPTVLGAMLGFGIGNISDMFLAISLCVASGAMIYIVFCEIFPQSILMCKSKAPAFAAIAGILIGLLIINIL